MSTRQLDVAYSYMEKAYALAPRDIRLIYAMGETKKSMREWDMAQGFLDQLQRLDPTHSRTLQLQGEILAGRDSNFQEAVRNFIMVRQETLQLGNDVWRMLILDHDYEAEESHLPTPCLHRTKWPRRKLALPCADFA